MLRVDIVALGVPRGCGVVGCPQRDHASPSGLQSRERSRSAHPQRCFRGAIADLDFIESDSTVSRCEAHDRLRMMMGSPSRTLPGPSARGCVQVLPFAGGDDDLLALVRRGGGTAAAVVYDRFGDEVNRIVGRLLGPDADHDDVVHDAFVQILRGLPRLREAAALRGFVRAVTINTVRSELRRRRFRRAFWSSDEAPEPSDDTLDPESAEAARRIYAILDRLAADLRIAFTLRFVERHSLAEVATMTGCSLATAKRRIARATLRFGELARSDDDLAARIIRIMGGGVP
jgi:RNA polymerase sigma-70 factor, ECF subfamily